MIKSLLSITRSLVGTGLCLAFGLAPSAASAALISGGNFGGTDLTPSDGDVLSGTFTNVGTFTLAPGTTVFIDQGTALSITASQLNIFGILDGTGAGFAGGASVPNSPSGEQGEQGGINGLGPGAGTGGMGGLIGSYVHGTGGGGGGYGGAGGSSAPTLSEPPPAAGGLAYGNATSFDISMGSGGGSGSKYTQPELIGASGAGGTGGGAVSLFGTINLDGSILVDGANGFLGTGINSASGGGGAGGGVLLSGTLLLDGLISATGGNGGSGDLGGLPSAGGGGGGGRIKLFGSSLLGSNFTFDVSGGNGGPGSGGVSEPGANGTFFNNTVPISVPEPSSTLGLLILSAIGIGSALKNRRLKQN